jgi:hypothetical protein
MSKLFKPTSLPGKDSLRSWFSPSRWQGVDNKDRYDLAGWVTTTGNPFGTNGAPSWSVGGLNSVQNALLFDGVDDSLDRPVPASVIGDDVAFTMIFAAQVVGLTSVLHPLVSLCGGSVANGVFAVGAHDSGAWYCSKRGDGADTATSLTGGTVDNDPHVFAVIHTGTATTLRVDATTPISAAAQDKLTMTTPSKVMLGHTSAQGAPTDSYGNVKIGDVAIYAGALTDPTLAHIIKAMRNAYDL